LGGNIITKIKKLIDEIFVLLNSELTEESIEKIDSVIEELNNINIEKLSEADKADILNKISAVQKRIEEKQKEIITIISNKNKESKYLT
jgi:flagellin-specific chaperone FliS